jgi:ankyrin repeat protein
MATTRTVDEVLASVCDVFFPCFPDERPVAIDHRASDGDTPLHALAWRNDVEGAEVLVEAGADVNAVGDMGETPLHVAIANNSLEMAELLLRSGANCEIQSEFGETPREKALRQGGPIANLF